MAILIPISLWSYRYTANRYRYLPEFISNRYQYPFIDSYQTANDNRYIPILNRYHTDISAFIPILIQILNYIKPIPIPKKIQTDNSET
jgi:hypothetical protein